jgi:hypothetical protein
LVNFFGLMLTATSLGTLNGWSTWQFAGLFGTIEAAAGLASVLLPNVWHLPVAELETSQRTRTHLSPSSIGLPHWGGAARFVAGAALILAAGWHYGVTPAASLIAPLVVLLAVAMLSASLLAARLGVRFAETDVLQLLVRWRGVTRELKPLSLSASLLQFMLNIIPLPAAGILSASVLFRPELTLSREAFFYTAAVTTALVIATALAWSGRISWEAPREQQQEIEAKA